MRTTGPDEIHKQYLTVLDERDRAIEEIELLRDGLRRIADAQQATGNSNAPEAELRWGPPPAETLQHMARDLLSASQYEKEVSNVGI